jgi:rhamnosyltransferase
MSTYNGVVFLDEQVESIRSQTVTNWRLLVRDDGSSDDTRQAVERLAANDSRIVLLENDGKNLGPARSFIRLLGHSTAPYFMFCDQDDRWLPQKIEWSLESLRKHEDVPHLVFTDLNVVDESLQVISPSFMDFQRFDPVNGTRFNRLLMQNIVPGCTIAGNRALKQASGLCSASTPGYIVMHDWLLALVATAFGAVTYVDRPTMMYRQHSQNCLGAPGSNARRYVKMLLHDRPWLKAQVYLGKVCRHAASFGEYYHERLSDEQRRAVQLVSKLNETNVSLGLLRCFRAGIQMNGLERNVALWLSNLPGLSSRQSA